MGKKGVGEQLYKAWSGARAHAMQNFMDEYLAVLAKTTKSQQAQYDFNIDVDEWQRTAAVIDAITASDELLELFLGPWQEWAMTTVCDYAETHLLGGTPPDQMTENQNDAVLAYGTIAQQAIAAMGSADKITDADYAAFTNEARALVPDIPSRSELIKAAPLVSNQPFNPCDLVDAFLQWMLWNRLDATTTKQRLDIAKLDRELLMEDYSHTLGK